MMIDKNSAPAGASTVVPRLEEQVQVHKVKERVGAVRVRKRVVEEQKDVDIDTFRETVHTVRVPVGRVVEQAEAAHQRDNVWVIPVYEERWVRQLVLVEEVQVTKLRESAAQVRQMPTRREEVVIERFDPATSRWIPESPDPSGG